MNPSTNRFPPPPLILDSSIPMLSHAPPPPIGGDRSKQSSFLFRDARCLYSDSSLLNKISESRLRNHGETVGKLRQRCRRCQVPSSIALEAPPLLRISRVILEFLQILRSSGKDQARRPTFVFEEYSGCMKKLYGSARSMSVGKWGLVVGLIAVGKLLFVCYSLEPHSRCLMLGA